MRQTIHISGLPCETIIGIYSHEQEAHQPLIIDVNVTFDASKVMANQDITDTSDYEVLTQKILQFIESSRYQLVENLMHDLLQYLAKDGRILLMELTIHKPQALAKYGAETAISASWQRSD